MNSVRWRRSPRRSSTRCSTSTCWACCWSRRRRRRISARAAASSTSAPASPPSRLPQTAVYTATKGAVDAITGVLANELGPRKIRVNTVSPSLTETEGTHSAGMIASEFEAGIIAQTPLGRLGQPQDIADVVAFVASDEARWLTGERILAGGGLR